MAMDVEKTMEFILEQQAQAAAIRMQHEADIARIDVEMRQVDLRLRQLDLKFGQVDLRLRRAIRLAVQEARAERKRRREADERFELKMDQIASAHLMNEEMVKKLGEKMDKYADDMRHPGGNGHPQ
jgi:hypothetical protein